MAHLPDLYHSLEGILVSLSLPRALQEMGSLFVAEGLVPFWLWKPVGAGDTGGPGAPGS